ncbi:hypothetical protein BBJ28_00005933 [Nothophytophthora sp. Chile5]|nr:hypothetical protein BBJ28_00005933 [Nothophytophthora sp. Chile5]
MPASSNTSRQVVAEAATSKEQPGLKRLASAPQIETWSSIAVEMPAPSKPSIPAPVHRCTEPECSRRFNRKYTLIEHMKTHTGEKPHVCPVRSCSKRFSTSGNLSRHKRLHGFIQPLECPVDGCLSSFPSNNKLEKHMKFHLGSAVHVCTIGHCGKTFSTTGNLNRHVKHQHLDASSASSPSQGSAPSPTSGEQQSTTAYTSSYTALLLDSSMEVSQPPAAKVEQLPQFIQPQAPDNCNRLAVVKIEAFQQRCPPVVPTATVTWHSDEMVDALTEIFDEAVAQPDHAADNPTQLEDSESQDKVSILDDMISFHVAHLP